jgi:tetratricopeptide (TPR) repeat protein
LSADPPAVARLPLQGARKPNKEPNLSSTDEKHEHDDEPDEPTWDPTAQPEEHLAALEAGFLQAMEEIRAGHGDEAGRLLKEILRAEPRLAEPHLELARLALADEELDDAELHAREALRLLEAGGQWIDDLPAESLLGMAHALLAEVLRSRCESDDALFGDGEAFKTALLEARQHYEAAAKLDPDDARAVFYALHLGKER